MKRRRKTVEAIFSTHLFIFTFFCFYPVPLLSISLTIFYFIHHFSPTLSSPLLFSPILSYSLLSYSLLFSPILFSPILVPLLFLFSPVRYLILSILCPIFNISSLLSAPIFTFYHRTPFYSFSLPLIYHIFFFFSSDLFFFSLGFFFFYSLLIFSFILLSKDERSRSYPIESVIVALPGGSVYNPPEGVAVKRVTDDKLQGSFMLKINIFELFQLSFIFLLFYFSLISVTADIFSVFSKNIHLFVSFD